MYFIPSILNSRSVLIFEPIFGLEDRMRKHNISDLLRQGCCENQSIEIYESMADFLADSTIRPARRIGDSGSSFRFKNNLDSEGRDIPLFGTQNPGDARNPSNLELIYDKRYHFVRYGGRCDAHILWLK